MEIFGATTDFPSPIDFDEVPDQDFSESVKQMSRAVKHINNHSYASLIWTDNMFPTGIPHDLNRDEAASLYLFAREWSPQVCL
jgi:hypothetical protein